MELPTGTVTFLFADIEGSTDLVEELGDRPYAEVLTHYRGLVRDALEANHGTEVDTQGDAFFVAFPSASEGLAAAIAIQQAVASHAWPRDVRLRVRIGLHTGEPVLTATGYVGIDVHRAHRICDAGHGGQVLLSEATANLIQSDLPSTISLVDLRVHRLKDLPRPERIFQVRHPALPDDFPPLRSLSAAANNLPVQLTTFIGRIREIEEVRGLLGSDRLVTLTGPGGCGKTRLALRVAADVLDQFSHGVWLVELATLSDPALVPHAVAAVLGLREEGRRDMTAALAEYLRDRRLLLLVDGCEHLLGACARLADVLLRVAPELRILASSRQRLGIAGEIEYRVAPLSLPRDEHPHTLEELWVSDASLLFVERALLSRPDFAPTDASVPAIAQIVGRLDGIPLAIELAAARMKVLSVDQIASRLDHRFQLLTGGSRSALPRQQTLEAAIDWSYELLGESERALLRRLSVFADRFTLPAVKVVCADEVGDPEELLFNLVDKSLVIPEAAEPEMRYRMLESVREYSREKLAAAGEAEDLLDRHLAFFLDLAEDAAGGLQGPRQQESLDHLEGAWENVRAALARTLAHGPARNESLRLASALWRFWFERGHWKEGREWLERVLESHHDSPSTAYLRVQCVAAAFAWRQGDHRRAEELSAESEALQTRGHDRWAEAFLRLNRGFLDRRRGAFQASVRHHQESLRIFRELGDEWAVRWSQRLLGISLWHTGDYRQAHALFEESLQQCRLVQDHVGEADALHGLGRTAAYEGHFARAMPFLDGCLGLYRRFGMPAGVAQTLYVLARVETGRGNLGPAAGLVQQSLEIFRRLGDASGVVSALTLLGRIKTEMRDYASAAGCFRQSLTLWKEQGYGWDRWGLAEFMESLAALAIDLGRPEAAAMLFASAEALRARMGTPLPPIDHARHARELDVARSSLGEAAFGEAWTKGENLPVEQVLSLNVLEA